MTGSPESWRRICAVLDRVTSRAESVADACAAEGVSVEDVAPYLEAEPERLPEQIEPGLVDEALRAFADAPQARPLAPGERLGPVAPIEVVVPNSGVVAGVYVQAISAYAPHPNAAKLWMEYLYSDEGQLGWLKGYCHPIRFNDIAAKGGVPRTAACFRYSVTTFDGTARSVSDSP